VAGRVSAEAGLNPNIFRLLARFFGRKVVLYQHSLRVA
jgi:hypothetical protein